MMSLLRIEGARMKPARVAALALWAAVLYCVPAQAGAPSARRTQETPQAWTPEQCRHFGLFAGVAADVRDAGATLRAHIKVFHRRHEQVGPALKRVLERELARVYAEALPVEKAELAAYTRCMTGQHTAKES